MNQLSLFNLSLQPIKKQ